MTTTMRIPKKSTTRFHNLTQVSQNGNNDNNMTKTLHLQSASTSATAPANACATNKHKHDASEGFGKAGCVRRRGPTASVRRVVGCLSADLPARVWLDHRRTLSSSGVCTSRSSTRFGLQTSGRQVERRREIVELPRPHDHPRTG